MPITARISAKTSASCSGLGLEVQGYRGVDTAAFRRRKRRLSEVIQNAVLDQRVTQVTLDGRAAHIALRVDRQRYCHAAGERRVGTECLLVTGAALSRLTA